MDGSAPRRLERLAEELEESGFPHLDEPTFRALFLDEVDRCLRPSVHERQVPSSGTILEPEAPPGAWTAGTQLEITHIAIEDLPFGLADARRYVDGLSSWLVRRTGSGRDEWLLFDRPAGSERDLVVLAESLQACIVQRHPAGVVRIVNSFGVFRWEGLRWHHEPPISTWLGALTADADGADPEVLEALLRLAVHDLGALGIGALLIYRIESGAAPRGGRAPGTATTAACPQGDAPRPSSTRPVPDRRGGHIRPGWNPAQAGRRTAPQRTKRSDAPTLAGHPPHRCLAL